MTREVIRAPAADDPVRVALADAEVRRRLLNAVRGLLYRRHADQPADQRADEAKEIAQEVARRALHNAAAYDPARPVLNWLVGYAIEVCQEQTRRRPAGIAAAPTDNTPPLEQFAIDLARPVDESVADRLDTQAILDQLPPEDQDLLRARFFEDASAAAIGERQGISEGAVRVRLFRALERMGIRGQRRFRFQWSGNLRCPLIPLYPSQQSAVQDGPVTNGPEARQGRDHDMLPEVAWRRVVVRFPESHVLPPGTVGSPSLFAVFSAGVDVHLLAVAALERLPGTPVVRPTGLR